MDNLLERAPGGNGVHPDVIINDVMVEEEGEVPVLHDDSRESSDSSEDLSAVESEGSEDDEELEEPDDNFNSAGEEVTETLC